MWEHSWIDTKLTMAEELHQECGDMIVMTMRYDCNLNLLTTWGHDKSVFCEAWTLGQGDVRHNIFWKTCGVN